MSDRKGDKAKQPPECKIDEMGVLLTLTVHPEDMGKIIGKSSKTAEALRILLRVVGMKGNARVNLKINEPVGGKRTLSEHRIAVEDGQRATLLELAKRPDQ